MTIDELIYRTKKDSEQIKKHFDVLYNFQQIHPWFIKDALEELSPKEKKKTPSFEDIIKWRTEYFIDDYSKIYHQVVESNPNLISSSEPQLIYFYLLKKDMYKRQRAKGYEIGDRDKDGALVTGSDLFIDVTGIDLKEFLGFYYANGN